VKIKKNISENCQCKAFNLIKIDLLDMKRLNKRARNKRNGKLMNVSKVIKYEILFDVQRPN
jgi:hypothetical protein